MLNLFIDLLLLLGMLQGVLFSSMAMSTPLILRIGKFNYVEITKGFLKKNCSFFPGLLYDDSNLQLADDIERELSSYTSTYGLTETYTIEFVRFYQTSITDSKQGCS